MQETIKEIVRKSRKDKYIANQKIEIGETSVERPERMPLQMLQKHQKGTKQIASKKKKNWTLMYILPYSTSLYVFHSIVNYYYVSQFSMLDTVMAQNGWFQSV